MCTLFYAITRRFFWLFDASVHTERTRVATITRLKSSSWRVQARRKGKYVNETFLRRKDAEEWGIDIERRIDRHELTTTRQSRDVPLFFLDERLGHLQLSELDRKRLIKFEKSASRRSRPRDGRHRSWIHQAGKSTHDSPTQTPCLRTPRSARRISTVSSLRPRKPQFQAWRGGLTPFRT